MPTLRTVVPQALGLRLIRIVWYVSNSLDRMNRYRHCEQPIVAKFLDACEKVGVPKIDDTSKPGGPLGATYLSSWIDQNGESE